MIKQEIFSLIAQILLYIGWCFVAWFVVFESNMSYGTMQLYAYIATTIIIFFLTKKIFSNIAGEKDEKKTSKIHNENEKEKSDGNLYLR